MSNAAEQQGAAQPRYSGQSRGRCGLNQCGRGEHNKRRGVPWGIDLKPSANDARGSQEVAENCRPTPIVRSDDSISASPASTPPSAATRPESTNAKRRTL